MTTQQPSTTPPEEPPTSTTPPSPPPLGSFSISPTVSSDFQKSFKSLVHTQEHYAQYYGICVGAFVFNPAGHLLLVQRAPTDSMPLHWEVPGGSVDLEDASILHGVARELREETGLTMTRVVDQVGGEFVFWTRSGIKACKSSFLVEVREGEEVRLNPEEHVNFLWVSEEEARAKRCGEVVLEYTTDAQEESIYDAFGMRKGTHGDASQS